MNYYTSTIQPTLAEKLKEKGMPITLISHNMGGIAILKKYPAITYAEVFDWLMEKGLSCEITRYVFFALEEVCPEWDWSIEKVGPLTDAPRGYYANTWHEAATKAIEKALELI